MSTPNSPAARDTAEAHGLLEAELERLAPRRAALGEGGLFEVAAWSLQMAYEWEAASLAWTRAAECLPLHAPARFHLGVCRLELGDLDGAAACFELALTVDADVAEGADGERLDWFEEDPHYKLGNVAHLRGDLEAAVAAYDRSARVNLTAVDALTEIVRCRLAQRDGAAALEAVDRLERRSSRPSVVADVTFLRGEARKLRGDGG